MADVCDDEVYEAIGRLVSTGAMSAMEAMAWTLRHDQHVEGYRAIAEEMCRLTGRNITQSAVSKYLTIAGRKAA